jgi:hypothetical protein
MIDSRPPTNALTSAAGLIQQAGSSVDVIQGVLLGEAA